MMNKARLYIFVAFIVNGCGAPSKSASEVAYLFDREVDTIQQKLTDLCDNLTDRDEAPNLGDGEIDAENCDRAGLIALNLKEIKSFYFEGLDSPTSKEEKEGKIIHLPIRTQLWLNQTILGFAAKVQALLADKQQAKIEDNSILEMPSLKSNDQFANLAQITATVIKKPKIDTKDYSFSMLINLKIEGIVTADNDIAINGQLIGNAIAVTIKTTEEKTFKESLLKNFETLIVMIPHSQDIYFDVFADLQLYGLGIKKTNDAIKEYLTTGIKSIVDSFLHDLSK